MWTRFTPALASIAACSLGAARLPAQDLIMNGGFEAGLAGWSVSGAPTTGGCQTNWQTSPTGGIPGVHDGNAGTGCMGVGGPFAGALSAYNSFDGAGPLNFILTQSFVIPFGVTSARLRFSEAARHAIAAGAEAREFNAFLIGGAEVINPFRYVATPGGTSAAGAGHDWTSWDFDVTTFAMGNSGGVTLAFEAMVPQSSTGPAGIGLDDVSFEVRTGAVVPEPASIVLVASGLLFVGGLAVRRRGRRS